MKAIVGVVAIVATVAIAGLGLHFVLIKPGVEEPTVTTSPVTSITNTLAKLNASFTVGTYASVEVWFECNGMTTAHATYTESGTHSEIVTGLTPDTTYSLRAVLKYNGTTIYGDTLSFTTFAPTSGPFSRGRIRIYSDDEFTPADGVVSGLGTQADPYIIEGWAISSRWGAGIYIENTTKYFVIRNCLIENSDLYVGIYLRNVINGRIENNTCEKNKTGIFLQHSSNNTLTGNSCSNNKWSGITLYDFSNNNILSSNACRNNAVGITIDENSSYNTLTGNDLLNNKITPYLDSGFGNTWG